MAVKKFDLRYGNLLIDFLFLTFTYIIAISIFIELSNGYKVLRQKKLPNENRPLNISVWRTFKYASYCDISLMTVGSLCAIFTGSCLPIAGFIFGSMTDVFLSRSLYGALPDNTTARGVYEMNKTFGATHNGLNVKLYTESEFSDALNIFLIIYLGIGTAIIISSFVQTLCWEIAGENQVHAIRKFFFSQIIRQDIAWYDKNEDGNLPNRLSDDLEVIRDGIGHKCVMVVQHLSTFVTGIGIGLYVNLYTTLVCLCVGPFLIAVTAYNAKFSANSMAREQMKYAKAGSVAEETLTNMKIVGAYSGQSIAANKYFEALKEGKKFAMTRYHYLSFCMCITFFFMYAGYGVGFWHGAKSVANGLVTPGSVFTVLFSVVAGALTIGQALPYISIVSAAVGIMGSIDEIMKRKVTIDPYSSAGIKPTQLIGHIAFKDVNFSYPTRPLVKILNGLTFDIKPGQIAAIVGSSGAGKSTIVGLIQRFYDVTSGEICIDGVSLKDLNVKWIRSQIGLVSQEPVLFGVSIAENIMYGKRDATRADVEEAAKQANAHNFIIKLPMGYDTLVGDTGSQLSGGQKQRIAIARALIRNPKILLLDEATSALDARSEGIVQETLSKVMRGRTTVIVAHRLSTIKNADVIYVMKNGELFESGTHETLMQNRSLYHSLVLAQMSPSNYLNESDEYSTDCATEDESEAEEFKIQNSTSALKIIDEESQSIDCTESTSQENNLKREELRESKTRTSTEDSEHKIMRMQSHQTSRRRSAKQRSSTFRSKNNEKLKTPSSGSEQTEKDITSWGILKMQKPQAVWLTLGFFGSIGVGIIPPMCALLFGQIYHVFTLTGQAFTDAYIFWTWVFFAFSFYCGLVYLIWTKGMCESSEGLLLHCRKRIFVNILRQPVGWFDFETSSPGILISRLARNVPLIKSAAGLRVGQVVSSIVTMIGSFIVAVMCGWKLAFALAVCVPIFIYAAYKQTAILKRNQWRDALLMDSAGRVASESVRNIRTVKSLGQEQLFTEIYTKHLELPHKESKSVAVLYSMVYAVMHGTSYYMYAINFRLGGYLVQTGEMASDDIYRVYFALSLCATSVGTSFMYLQDYSKALNAARVLNYLLSRETEIDPDSPYGVKPELQGSVEFNDVQFIYPIRPNVIVLKGVSLSVQAGKTLALVGESGCGKSTVISLLERYYDPVSGVVTVDGHDIKTINLNHLRSHIGIVNQEPTLFDCSIRENIAYGAKSLNIDVTFELIEKVARTANIHDFVMSLPMNYDTVVGERGIQLSGGQKQRIAIARALIRDPKILLLDEATSALDTENEKIVQAALDKAKEGRTCITVAHRLSTIRNADEICVLSNGRIVERGTHDELYALKGYYFELTQRQCV